MASAIDSRKREARQPVPGRELTARVAGEPLRRTARPAVKWSRRRRRSFVVRLRMFLRSVTIRLSSSLTRRIVVLNLGGLVALLLLFLYVNQFREGLIDARVQSLQAQGEIIAAAISGSASATTDSITVDPEKLLQLAPGQSTTPEEENPLEFSINPERVGQILTRLVSPTRTRARIFGKDRELILDSRTLSLHSIQSSDLPAPNEDADRTIIERTWSEVRRRFGRTEVPLSDDRSGKVASHFPEVAQALKGTAQSVVRVNARGDTIVSVAVPIRYFQTIKGALLLSTQGGDIDNIIASERWAIFRVFLVAAGVTFVLSLFLAGTIAGPMRRLAEAAERVRRGVNAREQIPDFTARADEIGHLSSALRDMTDALYNRMEATERFAADVAHELKNPLTSLRSAVETLPRIKSEEPRDRLMSIIQHDIRRLDRLISDISDASRLDAELARGRTASLDVAALLRAVVGVAGEIDRGDRVRFELTVEPIEREEVRARQDGYTVEGHDSRLGQVFNNLIDNARSFSVEGGIVRIGLRRALRDEERDEGELGVEVTVEDDGPGIPAHAFERIFERFYTDRPGQGFGQNSGLGLSISRQIIEAHGGRIWAANRLQPRDAGDADLDRDGSETVDERVLGARFTIWLPSSPR